MEATIERPMSSEEKRKADFIEVSHKSKQEVFSAEVAKFQQECLKAKKPFCAKCARDEWNEKLFMKMRKAGLQNSDGTIEARNADKFDIKVDLEQYAEASHFKLVGTEPILVWEILPARDGRADKKQVQTGVWKNFKCVRGFGLSVECAN